MIPARSDCHSAEHRRFVCKSLLHPWDCVPACLLWPECLFQHNRNLTARPSLAVFIRLWMRTAWRDDQGSIHRHYRHEKSSKSLLASPDPTRQQLWPELNYKWGWRVTRGINQFNSSREFNKHPTRPPQPVVCLLNSQTQQGVKPLFQLTFYFPLFCFSPLPPTFFGLSETTRWIED